MTPKTTTGTTGHDTQANTGIRKGAAVVLENMVQRNLLYLGMSQSYKVVKKIRLRNKKRCAKFAKDAKIVSADKI